MPATLQVANDFGLKPFTIAKWKWKRNDQQFLSTYGIPKRVIALSLSLSLFEWKLKKICWQNCSGTIIVVVEWNELYKISNENFLCNKNSFLEK